MMALCNIRYVKFFAGNGLAPSEKSNRNYSRLLK